eukprot:PhF_6_TR27314/c0_g1_i2/m.40121/K16745/B9D2; B9 domain-containing protein 2
MAEVFLLGSLEHAQGFGQNDLFVSFEFLCGPLWEKVHGLTAAQTSVARKNKKGQHVWLHPIDLHYTTQCVQGWPKVVVRLWEIDTYGRKDFVGYGMTHVPLPAPNNNNNNGGCRTTTTECVVPIWKPMLWDPSALKRTWMYLRQLVMGGAPRLKDDSLVYQSDSRYKMYSGSGGSITFRINVLCKNFGQLNIAVE